MNAVIVYYSKTGFTERYAKWLSARTGIPAQPWNAKMELRGEQTVIFASSMHAGSIRNLAWLKEKAPAGARKVVLVTGACPPEHIKMETIWLQNFKESRDGYELFYLPGGLCYEKMSGADRILMKLVAKMMHGKKDKTPDEQGMADAVSRSFDSTDEARLEPVIACLSFGK